MAMTPARGAVGAALVVFAYLTAEWGLPPDGVAWIFTGVPVGFAAAFGASAVLAARHLLAAPRRGVWLLVSLIVGAAAVGAYGAREHARVAEFMTTADSVPAVVLGHNVFGNALTVVSDTRYGGQYQGRRVESFKRAHASLEGGDTLWLYVAGSPGGRVEAWPAGPDAVLYAARLLKTWIVVGVFALGVGVTVFGRRQPAA